MLKKILACILATMLFITLLPATSIIAAPFEGNGIIIGAGKTIIEAEAFDSEFYAECTSPWGPQFAGRPDEKVATEGASNAARTDAPNPNYNIGWISEGDWVQYTVIVEETGAYKFDAWLASGSGAGNQGYIKLSLDGKLIGSGTASKSTGWQDYQLYGVGEAIVIKAGKYVLKAEFPAGGVNLDAIIVTKIAPFSDIVIGAGKTVIEAEAFDSGHYYESNAADGAHDGRPDEGVQTEFGANAKRDDAPDLNFDIGWTAGGEWVAFVVEVEETGVYDFAVWLASGSGTKGGAEIYVNGVKVGYNNASKSTGWQDWDLYPVGKALIKAGTNVIKAVFPEGNMNLDAIVINKVVPYSKIVFNGGKTVIEAEAFDSGFYYESNAADGNHDGRPDQGVQTEYCANAKRDDAPDPNFDIGWTAGGEWVAFIVEVTVPGAYDFSVWLASGSGTKGGAEIYVNDVKVGYNNSSKSTGWQDWDLYNVGVINIDKGVNVIKAVFPEGNMNLDAIEAVYVGRIMKGEIIGAEGGWGGNAATGRKAAFDGDLGTFFDPANAKDPENVCGIKMSEKYYLTQIRIHPRSGFAGRFKGASIYGFNEDVFDLETATLIWRSDAAAAEPLKWQIINADQFIEGANAGFTSYVYFNDTEHGDVAEIVLCGLPVRPSLSPELEQLAGVEMTFGDAYGAAAMVLAQFIDPAIVLANKNAKIDISDSASLMVYAKAVGLLTDADIIKYNQTFFKDGKKFDFDNALTRQEYASVIYRVFEIFKKHGVEFTIQEEGIDGGIQVKNIIDRKGDRDWGEYRDYRDLNGMYEQAFDFALAIGALKTKKFSETKTVVLARNVVLTQLIEIIDGVPVLVDVEKFLAPNDIISYGEMLADFIPILLSADATAYTRFVEYMRINAVPAEVAAPVVVEKAAVVEAKDEDAGDK